MKKQTTVKVTAMTRGTFGSSKKTTVHGQFSLGYNEECCTVGHTNLERSRVEREAISMDEHPQSCQGDEEPASKGGKIDELVDLSSD